MTVLFATGALDCYKVMKMMPDFQVYEKPKISLK